ncbi:MAG: hypothetical protein NUV75_07080 [Gallionella sp.]|nr:hypothetical protein [Gallionella sp.]
MLFSDSKKKAGLPGRKISPQLIRGTKPSRRISRPMSCFFPLCHSRQSPCIPTVQDMSNHGCRQRPGLDFVMVMNKPTPVQRSGDFRHQTETITRNKPITMAACLIHRAARDNNLQRRLSI